MNFHAIYEKIISIPSDYGDMIINFLSEDKTLNFLQSVGIIVAILAAFRTISIARRIQRRHYRNEYSARHSGAKVQKHKKRVKEHTQTSEEE